MAKRDRVRTNVSGPEAGYPRHSVQRPRLRFTGIPQPSRFQLVFWLAMLVIGFAVILLRTGFNTFLVVAAVSVLFVIVASALVDRLI